MVSLVRGRPGGGGDPGGGLYDTKKFVRTSALNQPLVFNPHSSAHKTFKAYSSNSSPGGGPSDRGRSGSKKRKGSRERGSSEGGGERQASLFMFPRLFTRFILCLNRGILSPPL